MARCPFATFRVISGSSGPHVGGPFKIVHHTTEGSSAAGAFAAFTRNRSDPHFTVDAETIFQHIDTSEGARALRNDPGGVQTNRDSAIQIELVGFAHLPKNVRAMENLARLCRWIESTHGVPAVWPSGPPKPAKNGKDPGGHNRDAATWESKSGHYGHSHVPENTHWDPAFSAEEAAFVLTATFDANGKLTSPPLPPVPATRDFAGPPESTMPDHDVVPVGVTAYIRDLPVLAGEPTQTSTRSLTSDTRSRDLMAAPTAEAKVDVGSVVSFVGGLSDQARDDVLFSVQLAQRGASGSFDRFTQTRAWYQKYIEILENLGWATEQFAFTLLDQSEGELRMDEAALAVVTAIATQNQLAILRQSIDALSKLAEDDGTLKLFDFHSSTQGSGNFQLGVAESAKNGAVSMALGAFYFRSTDDRKRFLFFKWGKQQVNFWSAAQRMTLNTAFYASRRDEVIAKLKTDAATFVADLKLG
ncbi:MAG: N-acetylmuramoyl-L-alanine amidase [Burkholderiaceae bacterium]